METSEKTTQTPNPKPSIQKYHIRALKNELSERVSRNPSYSLRSFAKSLGMSPGGLADILNGRRRLTLKRALKLAEIIKMDPEKHEAFIISVRQEEEEIRSNKKNGRIGSHETTYQPPKLLDVEVYRLISEWYHYAIMELTYSDDFQDDPRWLSSQLGITVTQAKIAFERLTDLGLIQYIDGKYKKTQGPIIDTKDKNKTTSAMKTNQKVVREMAIQAIDTVDIERRSMTTMTMCIDKEVMPLAKKEIEEFQVKLCKLLESGKRKEVYLLEVGLFPAKV